MFGCYVKDPTLTFKAVQMSSSWKNMNKVVCYCQAARLHKHNKTKIFNVSLNEDYFLLFSVHFVDWLCLQKGSHTPKYSCLCETAMNQKQKYLFKNPWWKSTLKAWPITYWLVSSKDKRARRLGMFDRPGVARAVLQTALWFSHNSLSESSFS